MEIVQTKKLRFLNYYNYYVICKYATNLHMDLQMSMVYYCTTVYIFDSYDPRYSFGKHIC